jgi:hypothetical protein
MPTRGALAFVYIDVTDPRILRCETTNAVALIVIVAINTLGAVHAGKTQAFVHDGIAVSISGRALVSVHPKQRIVTQAVRVAWFARASVIVVVDIG